MSYQPVGNGAVASSVLASAQHSDWKRGTEPLKGDTIQQLSYCCSQIKDGVSKQGFVVERRMFQERYDVHFPH